MSENFFIISGLFFTVLETNKSAYMFRSIYFNYYDYQWRFVTLYDFCRKVLINFNKILVVNLIL